MIEYLVKLDTDLFLFLNGLHSPFWDGIMLFASGKLTWLPLYLLLVYFYCPQVQVEYTLVVVGRSHCGTAGRSAFGSIYLKMFFSA